MNAGSADQNTVSLQIESLETPSKASVSPGQRDDEINQRALRIASFCQQTSTPRGVAAFQQTV